MSEDVDFKITPLAADSISLNQRRKQLGSLRDRVTASLRAFGFSIDPTDSSQLRSRDGNRYIIYQLSRRGRDNVRRAAPKPSRPV